MDAQLLRANFFIIIIIIYIFFLRRGGGGSHVYSYKLILHVCTYVIKVRIYSFCF